LGFPYLLSISAWIPYEETLRRGGLVAMILGMLAGLLILVWSLFWGYVALVERGGSTVSFARGVLGAALVATGLALALWLIYVTAFLRVE
jgi:hypothetical protein